jgi:hypothetical protein
VCFLLFFSGLISMMVSFEYGLGIGIVVMSGGLHLCTLYHSLECSLWRVFYSNVSFI